MPYRNCEEKLKLLVEYQQLTKVHSAAIGDMSVREISIEEYRQMSITAEQARIAAMQARAHLNNHIGQMSYLVQALGHNTQEPPSW